MPSVMTKAKVRCEMVRAEDVRPGDLFSTAGLDYWDTALDGTSIGEAVYVRTNAPFPEADRGLLVYRLTVDRAIEVA